MYTGETTWVAMPPDYISFISKTYYDWENHFLVFSSHKITTFF